jgi:eukaryotic-like serine/threonine-protein kinase
MRPSPESIGSVLSGRYRLLSLLGTGASANVYLAQDLTLERQVAVKILQPSLVTDESFLKRFRAEARAVAALNHPNVLRVFDWGEENAVPYLVTEYLPGGSLKDILDQGLTLSVEQAAAVGSEAAAGLAYAHARGLVHRDIKPANLLFDEEGRARITDFGVARALAEASWTEPVGAMIGTVRYASPEQAEGVAMDGRADVYSLALVLYEAITGEIPFIGDTPLATLRARVGEPLPYDDRLVPLEVVLERAADPEVETRLDAAEVAARLESLISIMPPAMPLPIAVSAALTDTIIPGFRAPSTDELTQITPAVSGSGFVPSGVVAAVPAASFDQQTILQPPEAFPGAPVIRTDRTRRRVWPWLLLALFVAAAIFGFFAYTTKLFTPSVAVPSVIGQTQSQARTILANHHLQATFGSERYSDTVPAGSVISQDPGPHATLKENSSVALVVSQGLPPVTVPSLAGMTCNQATAALAAVKLVGSCPASIAAYSATVPVNKVVSWTYQGTQNPTAVPLHATVNIVISKGPPPIAVPAVGTSWDAAKATLSQAGFKPVQGTEYSSSVPLGQVTRTAPAAGSLAQRGSTVTVYTSLGPPQVPVPNLIGDSVAAATVALSKVGLKIGAVYGPPGGAVFSTSPSIGSSVLIGTVVNLYVR